MSAHFTGWPALTDGRATGGGDVKYADKKRCLSAQNGAKCQLTLQGVGDVARQSRRRGSSASLDEQNPSDDEGNTECHQPSETLTE